MFLGIPSLQSGVTSVAHNHNNAREARHARLLADQSGVHGPKDAPKRNAAH
jgi:hypothetical protein